MKQEGLKFSIVMPTYLGEYKTAASNREEKLERAIVSVLDQVHSNWELIVIADGCQKSVDIIKPYIKQDDRIKGFKIERDSLWAGAPRNTGIQKATGDFIIYLDADDEYRSVYLDEVAVEIGEPTHDWYIVDDIIYGATGYIRRPVKMFEIGFCGTSNLIHNRNMNVWWPEKGGYAHDYTFINSLRAASSRHKKLKALGYVVQHIPFKYDL